MSLVLGNNVGWHVLWRFPHLTDYGTRYLARGNGDARRDFGSWLGLFDWTNGIRSVIVMDHSRPNQLWNDLFWEVEFKCRIHAVPLWKTPPRAVKRTVRGMLTTGADLLMAARIRHHQHGAARTETVQEAEAVFLRESALGSSDSLLRFHSAHTLASGGVRRALPQGQRPE